MIKVLENSYANIEFELDGYEFFIYPQSRDGLVILSVDEVADLLSAFHAEKVKQDNIIKNAYV